ncbi:MAG: hybrid sensor histidine kinase/response regulator [Nitrospirae bacterium]|uniref:ATP-binding response regulator n=1 Tax=Candidatus Magnetobacterium casense TaxID=1455061 RepID=UPI00058C1EA2|nr:hybrid sensor histidine kinase/response regulator [Candidatus Magnetobacterium casensis]MBF0337151.1 hybrid sensor histidine kinase/response regulator [Nitrospirota bacterium]
MDEYTIKDELQKYSKDMDVLYVEDNEGIREDIAGILNKFFGVVNTADNGAKALDMYTNRCYDIVISDIRMPGLSGIELTGKIKTINPEQAMIITTAHDDYSCMYELINMGVDKFVTKPINLLTLLTGLLHVATRIHHRRAYIADMLAIARLSAMNEILAGIAHHWRQPLSAVSLYVQELPELYIDGQLDEQTLNNSVANIMQVIKSMSHTIDEFRQHCKQTEPKEVFSIADAIDDAVFIVKDTLNCNGISLIKEYETDITTEGNKRQFSNVLILELLCNGIEALLTNKPHNPYLKLHVTTKDNKTVITVSNNGGLISDKAISKLYEPYFSTKSVASGSGLGLYLARMLLEREFGGTISAINIDGGVEFRIEL